MTYSLKYGSIGIAVLIVIIVGIIMVKQPSSAGPGNDKLPADHWQQPLKPQGTPPAEWSALEQSLKPEDCGQCHADKYQQWQTSFHAHAMSPGLVGQLLTYDTQSANDCLECHAPLAEQKAAFASARARGEGHLPAAQGLAAVGNSCAGCHVREYKHFGPPQRDTGVTGQSDPENPHGGVFRTADFEKSGFCAVCHQFPQSYAINGKPLENTVAEWQASPQAAQNITCQKCHMPDRKHLWRGIHDPEMVKNGLQATFEATKDKARFSLKNTGVGHAFPTYITPKVIMHAVALDAGGRAIANTAVTHEIRREVGYAGGQWLEYSDTRLLPDEVARLDLDWAGSKRIRMWLEVYPDDYYEKEVYGDLVEGYAANSPEQSLIKQAIARAQKSNFTLFETIVKKPD